MAFDKEIFTKSLSFSVGFLPAHLAGATSPCCCSPLTASSRCFSRSSVWCGWFVLGWRLGTRAPDFAAAGACHGTSLRRQH